MLLIESLPELSRELTELLITAREPGLAAQIDDLEIGVAAATSFVRASTPLQSQSEATVLSTGTLN